MGDGLNLALQGLAVTALLVWAVARVWRATAGTGRDLGDGLRRMQGLRGVGRAKPIAVTAERDPIKLALEFWQLLPSRDRLVTRQEVHHAHPQCQSHAPAGRLYRRGAG